MKCSYDEIFKNKNKVMFVFAHPDDAELYSGGLIARLTNDKKEVRVIKVTGGDKGSRENVITQTELKNTRFNENKESMKVLGVSDKNNVYLDFEDGSVENNHETISKLAYQIREFKLILKFTDSNSFTYIKDLDNDGTKEIVYKYALSGSGNRERETLRWKDIWRLENGKVIKVNNQFPAEYKDLIPIYDESLTTQYNEDFYQFDYPVYRCLKEKAELNISGQFADAESCREIYRSKYK